MPTGEDSRISFHVSSEPDGKKFRLVVKRGDLPRLRVGKIKQQLESFSSVRADDQVLLLDGKVLKDETYGAHFGLEQGLVLTMIQKDRSEPAVCAPPQLQSGANRSQGNVWTDEEIFSASADSVPKDKYAELELKYQQMELKCRELEAQVREKDSQCALLETSVQKLEDENHQCVMGKAMLERNLREETQVLSAIIVEMNETFEQERSQWEAERLALSDEIIRLGGR